MRGIIIILMCIVPRLYSAQYTYWEHVIGEPGVVNEGYTNVVVDSEEIIAYGSSGDPTAPLLFRRYDMSGELLLESNVDLPYTGTFTLGVNQNFGKIPDEEEYLVCGNVQFVEIGNKIIMYRLNSNLDTVWTKYYEVGADVSATQFGAMKLRDSTIVIGGSTAQSNVFGMSSILMELDFDGNVLWEKTIAEVEEYHGYRITQVEEIDDGYLLAGTQRVWNNNSDVTPFRAMMTKTDFEGNVIWEFLLDDNPVIGRGNGWPSMLLKENGELIVGYSTPYELYYDPTGWALSWKKTTVAKLNYQGDEPYYEWEQVFFENHEKQMGGFYKIIEASDGGMVMTLAEIPLGLDPSSIARSLTLIKMDSLANIEWSYNYDYYSPSFFTENILFDLEQTSDGGYVMAGVLITQSNGIQNKESWLLKVDACGEVEWGGCEPVIGITEQEGYWYEPVELWPNPASETVHISLKEGYFKMVLYSSNGQLVLEKNISGMAEEIILELSNISSGLYMLQILNETQEIVGWEKMVVE